MSRLLNLYPPAWRERYRAEVEELLAIHPPALAERLDLVKGAIDAWIHPQVRRPSGGLVPDGPEWRVARVMAVVGGVLFAVSGLIVASSREITSEGYQDNGAGIPLLIVGMFLTGVAALAIADEGRSRRIAAVMVGGALVTILPWPIMIVGFFGYAGAAIALGAATLSRGQTFGLVPLAIGFILPSFNTETDWALVAVPVGILWVAYAFAVSRSGLSLRSTVPVRPVRGAPG